MEEMRRNQKFVNKICNYIDIRKHNSEGKLYYVICLVVTFALLIVTVLLILHIREIKL